MAIHPIKSSGKTEYVISSHRMWLPGVYATEKAARFAFRFDYDELKKLQESLNPFGVITFADLKKLKKSKCH